MPGSRLSGMYRAYFTIISNVSLYMKREYIYIYIYTHSPDQPTTRDTSAQARAFLLRSLK